MKHTITSGVLILGLAATAIAENKPAAAKAEKVATPAAEAPAKPKVDPAANKSDASYALGFRTGGTFGQQFGRFGVTAADLEQDTFIKGFMDALKDGKPSLDEARLQAAMEGLGAMLQEREKKLAEENLAAGNKFLETNGKRDGVTTTKSGLQYEVLNKGGDKKYEAPKDDKGPEKQFMVNYKGTLIDGKEFDASPAGQPVPMTLQVVEGFKEALTTMPIGAKWKLFLPAKLAYGEQRRSADIGPNTALIFELELVSIEDAPAEQGMPFQMPQGGQGAESGE
jgi:FKBP-type peptidyl-prolyl cis-trans isomerase